MVGCGIRKIKVLVISLSFFFGVTFSCIFAQENEERITSKQPVVFILDSFEGEDSHGENIVEIIRKFSLDKPEIIPVNLGTKIEHEEYLKKLSEILDFAKKNPRINVIINCSFGSYFYDIWEYNFIKELYERGVIIVAAAGNENVPLEVYPAAYDGTIAVGAVDRRGQKEDYSNYGTYVDIATTGFLKSEIVSI